MDMQTLAQEVLNAIRSGHNDATRLIRLHTDSALDQLLVERLDGVEQIGPAAPSAEQCAAGFRFTLSVLCTNASLEAKDWLGKTILIELLTQQSRIALRPFHGHITAFETLTADGGFGYYKLTVEPWLAFLDHRADSFVFHDMTVPEIIDSVFADYSGTGTLVPAWRWALSEDVTYAKRSITTQYRESDLAFIERLFAEEGLYYWFEHDAGGAADSNVGASLQDSKHTLVITDNTDAFTDNEQTRIRFHRASSTEQSDTIQHLASSRALATHSVEIASWDYRSLDTRTSSLSAEADEAATDMPLSRFDAPDAYLWPDRETGERYAARQIEALDAQRQLLTGSGTVRTLSPGTRFVLDDHFDSAFEMLSPATDDAEATNRYAVLRVSHHARNNLSPSLGQGLAAKALDLLGRIAKNKKDKPAKNQKEDPLYTNTFTLLPATLPYRPITQNDSGIVLRPRPIVSGTQTAIVVGAASEPVHTDRDGRIKIQFHWQRGANSHSRLAHPSGDENATADQAAWAWVRVMTQWAGASWGSSFIPRVGQEVLVDFIEGNIDRPVVIGTAYNGQGAQDAQNNQTGTGAGATTGNAPSWFAGGDAGKDGATESGNTGPKHAHRATLAGIKTQALTQSQQGAGGFNHLAFDLTPNEPRTQLATTQFASSLTLGANRHQNDNQRTAYRGHGAELVTAQSGAIRAGSGLLISTTAQANASGALLDSPIASTQLDTAQSLVKSLAESAQKQKADIKGEPASEKLAAAAGLAKSQKILEATETGSSAGTNVNGGTGSVPAWSEPMIVAESPAGIAALTPKGAVLVAGNTLTLAATDIHIASQGKQAWVAKDGIALYTYGKQSDGARPIKDLGLKLHAAKGKVSVQAQTDKADFNADKAVTITSTTADVLLQGKDKLMLSAGGAAIEISAGNITLTAPGVVDLKAGQRNFTSAKSSRNSMSLPVPSELLLQPVEAPHSLRFAALGADDLLALGWAGSPFAIVDDEGETLAQGVVAEDGRLPRITTASATEVKLRLGDTQGAQLLPIPRSTESTNVAFTAEAESDDLTDSHPQTFDEEISQTSSNVTSSRYYQEVVSATTHHSSEFLTVSQIRELLDKADN
ncbi:type VI secretion system tip protein TssI/VgrG [Uliginosibacterium sp. H3]|uniref:Type VI secretion system tip protein TssI/VgrG n=1 Tax=Uliginosibacterium silvisoli TaxID=3114758 RepID=A0ABU6K574_9RHOO|nr:type VI secretion system tip protein TssI/VgrG [Uliginosibacterium sp. H3]